MSATMQANLKKTPPTKSATVCKLLARPRGATVPEMMKATDWQNHSVRAFLTGLRKKGKNLVREERGSGDLAYRLAVEPKGEAEDLDAQQQ